ncbi:MAG: FAD-dependent oxidoreductase, partial [Proteobacteria bacterium]|nr:FAD-dependent oxidoreductase [Pseudomonadota bacterium]
MPNAPVGFSTSRRTVLRNIGLMAGSAAMYRAMTALGATRASKYLGPVDLSGVPRGASVLILGAGLAGMTAAYELRNAGYRVQVLEYNARPGGRNWTLRGGDEYTELGGARQRCEFDRGLYLNPGPWRIPYHHENLLHYCRQFNIALEPFVQINHNAYLQSSTAFGGKPQRYRAVKADYQGMVADLLAKVTGQGALDQEFSKQDRDMLRESLRDWGFLDENFRYVRGEASSGTRGWDKDPGGGIDAKPVPSTPMGAKQMLDSQLWRALFISEMYEFQPTILQPVGGMGR